MKTIGKILIFVLIFGVTLYASEKKSESDFSLRLEVEKKELYVGESIDVALLFIQKKGAKAVDSEFKAPSFQGFWVKKESQAKKTETKTEKITKIIYTIAPQRVGDLKIGNAELRVATRADKRDKDGTPISKKVWQSYFSNDLIFEIKALPGGVDLVGDFHISAFVDKTEVKANEIVDVRIEVSGLGNLEDIKSFELNIEEANVIVGKIEIKDDKLNQTLTFVAEEDFEIPSFSLKYFDPSTKKLKAVTTEAVKVKVKNFKPMKEPIVKKEEETISSNEILSFKSINMLEIIVIFSLGMIFGIVLMLLKPLRFIYKKRRTNSIKDPRILLIKLFNYINDKEVENIIASLEKKIYLGEKVTLDKKLLKEIVEKYKID